ncbi:carboxymuconolactone decarboxylase [Desulfonema ishimotonii]|uniref:Carboxymuconolactone decarboxylase n=1 Tax=Desulfonema ishimotonii TaxID=45657 RepID=A0A401FZA1_9BACT|nr:carboxymuconolactone decarboxylase family protein [Desulfonema ishimotonii]GBC62263.1 carboxymuconolactone decarboxylase [Desulfonema ishimotonii]
MKNERYEAGLKQLRALDAAAADGVLSSLETIAPEMARFIVEFAYGDVYARPGLDLKSRQIATVAALVALGNAAPRLQFHMGAALNVGCSPRELIEVIYVVTVFAGFPAGLNGIRVAEEVFRERNISVSWDRDEPARGDRHERGLKALAEISRVSGQDVVESLSDIAPDMGDFIVDFSYGDVLSRRGLDLKSKEIAVISACVARGTMTPQLRVHIRAALNVGCTQEEITETIMQMAVYSGFPSALNGLFAAREVFEAPSPD